MYEVGTSMVGIYIVLAELEEAQEIQIGKRHNFAFEKGFYGYVGSALGGLESRLAQHLSNRKKLHWHIDYLLHKAIVREIIYTETNQRKKCLVAQALSLRLPSILGFGCSDCDCPSHLFFCQDFEVLEECILDCFKFVSLSPLKINYRLLPSIQ